MKNILTKPVSTYLVPGTPGVPAIPALPYIPAYTTTEVVRVCSFQTTYDRGGSEIQYFTDANGNTYSLAMPTVGSGATSQWVCTNQTVTTTRPAQQARAASPAIPSTPDSIKTSYNLGWTGSAVSKQWIRGSGQAKFSAPKSIVGALVGFYFDTSAQYLPQFNSIEQGFYVSGGQALVYERGQQVANAGTYTDASVFTLLRRDGVVTYLVDDQLVWTSAIKSVGNVFLGALLYSGNDYVFDPSIGPISTAANPLPVLQAYGGAGAAKNVSYASLPLLTASAAFVSSSSSAAALPMFNVYAADSGGYSMAATSLLAFTSDSGAGTPIPQPVIISSVLSAFTVAGIGLVGTVGRSSASTPAIQTLASQNTYGQAVVQLPLLGTSANAFEGSYEASLGAVFFADASVTAWQEIVVVMNAAGSISDVLAVSVLADAAAYSGASITDSMVMSALMGALIQASATANAEVPVWDQPASAWVVNAETSASWNYDGFDFNSYAKIGDAYYGMKSDGLYRLGGDTDAGQNIAASVKLGMHDVGTSMQKRMQTCYLGMSASGVMYLRVVAGHDVYTYAARPAATDLRTHRVDIGKGLKANYFGFELLNSDGCDFDLDGVTFVAAKLSRRSNA